MGSQLRPGASGLNRILLDKEAQIKEFLSNLLSGPEGYNESNSMPMGPDVPNRMLEGATSIGPAPSFQPDSGYGGGGFGLNDFAPLLAAGITGRTPGENNSAPPRPSNIPSTPSAFTGELPPVHGSNTPSASSNLPPEVMAIVDNMLKSQGNSPIAPNEAKVASRPSILPSSGRSAAGRPSDPRIGPPSPQIENSLMGPEPQAEMPMDLSSLMGGGNSLATREPEPFIPEPFDLPPERPSMTRNEPIDDDLYASPATDEYLGNLRERPRHDDFEGSRARRILSGIMKGLLGGDFGVGDAPHQKALRSWRDEGSGLKEGAEIEQKDLVQRRLRQSDVFKQARAKREYELKVVAEVRRHKELVAKMEHSKDQLHAQQAIAEDKSASTARILEWKKTYESAKLAQGDRSLNMQNRRTNAYVADKENDDDDNITAPAQKAIRDEAKRRLKNDSRFSKWAQEDDKGNVSFNDIPVYNNKGELKQYKKDGIDQNGRAYKAGDYVIKEYMDEATKKMLADELVKQEEIVATRKRSSYRRSGFPNPFDMPVDEPELDLEGIFNGR